MGGEQVAVLQVTLGAALIGVSLAMLTIGAPSAHAAPSPQAALQTPTDPAQDIDRAEAARLEAEAVALRDARDFAEASRRIGDLIPIELRLYGPSSELVANSHAFRAEMARLQGDFVGEAAHLRLEQGVRGGLPDEAAKIDVAFRLTRALTAAGDLAAAEAALLPAWSDYTAQFSPTLPTARQTVDPLVAATIRTAGRDEAKRLLAALDEPLKAIPDQRERWLKANAETLMAAQQQAVAAVLLQELAESRRERNATAAQQAEAWSQLADALGQAFEWPAAAEARRLALAQRERTRGGDVERESAYLGRALLESGENAEAYERLTRARAAFRGRRFNDRDRAYALVHLARAALETGRIAEGDALSLEALADRQDDGDADSSGLRLAMEVRADTLAAMNRFPEAEALLAEALALARADDPDGDAASVIESNLSGLRGVQGRRQDAEVLARRAVEDVSTRFGPESPQMVVVLGNLAVALSNSGEFERATPLIEKAVAIQRRVAGDATSGPAVRDLLSAEFKMGRIYGSAGRDEEAMTVLSDVHERAGRILGRTDDIAVDSGVQTGLLLIRAGRRSEAEVLLDKMVRQAELAHGPDSVELVEVLQLHAYALYELRRYPAALAAMRRMMGLLDAAAPRWPGTRIEARTNTAQVLIQLDRPAEALVLLREAGAMALERNARHAREGGDETGIVRTPFQNLVQAAWIEAGAG